MKNTIIGIVIGVCVTVTVLSVWYLFNINSRVTALENFATQVVNIINQSQKEAPTK